MNLEELQANWDGLAQTDPFWAILSDPAKRNENWKEDDFFKTGEEEIERVLGYLKTLDISFNRNIALDFGCGVGRLTQALCRHFQKCYGIDISTSMIKLADKFNRYEDKCIYQVNYSSDIKRFNNNYFDFIYAILVLQHMKPEYSKNYIKDFIRVLSPGGVLIFQLPSELVSIPDPLHQSVISKALPDSAFKAQISFEESSITENAGYQVTILVRVMNTSDLTWPVGNGYQICLVNHWLDMDKKLLIRNDGITRLTKDLGPMEEVELPLTFTTPVVPGNYLLELELIQEGIARFKDKGSETEKIRFEVKPHTTMNQPQSSVIRSKIEMYSVHTDEVIELIGTSGGKVVEVVEDHSAGREWKSFRYYVTK